LALFLTLLANRHCVAAAWLLLVPTRAAIAANLTGQAIVIDGDHGARIRFGGMMPESEDRSRS